MLLHALISASRANGPGLRAVVFFQGCSLCCPKCWNPSMHRFRGTEATVNDVVQEVLNACQEHKLEGVTFSGGEPMQQADTLLTLMYTLRQRAPELSFGMFSGYTEYELDLGQYWTWGCDYSERVRGRIWRTIQAYLDFAVLGRFDPTQPCILPLRSSHNQVLRLFSGRYNVQDFSEQLVEVTVHTDGRAELTGFPTLGLPW
jgi:anaerobic ribonucleoside-triphosphate reductase activating protein